MNTFFLSPFSVNDHVRILSEPEDSINAYARVEKVEADGVRVCNGNMPYLGTFSWKFFKNTEVSLVS